MKILKNKKMAVILLLLFGGFLCGCKNNSLDDVPDIEFTSEEKVNEYINDSIDVDIDFNEGEDTSNKNTNQYTDADIEPDVQISIDEDVDFSEGKDNAEKANNFLDILRDSEH